MEGDRKICKHVTTTTLHISIFIFYDIGSLSFVLDCQFDVQIKK